MFARTIEIKIIVTSDIHATVFPYDFINNRPLGYGLANISALMNVVNSQYYNKTILLDNGDLIQGQPTAYWANHIDENKTNLFARVLNYMQYDAATVGNHDIEAGPDVYNKINEQMDMPWLGANVIDKESGKPFFEPYKVIRRSGIKIAVLGLVTDAIPSWLPEKLWEGFEFQSLPEAASYWVNHIKEKEKPDAIIGLFHSGLGEFDPANPDDMPFGNASRYIAHFVPGFDVIFTAHDHTVRNKMVYNIKGDSVLIIGGGSHGRNVGVAHLDFERKARRVYSLKSKKGEILSIKNIPPDVEFMRRFDSEITEVFEFSNKLLGRTSTQLDIKEALFGSSAAIDFIHEVQLQHTEADISFAAPLSDNLSLRAGDIRMRNIFQLYPFENYLSVIELSGKEIKDFLEYSYSLWFNIMDSEDDFLLNIEADENNQKKGLSALKERIYNFDSAAGIKYTVNVSKPKGERVDIISFENGDEFSYNSTYRVALNSYRSCGGGLHLTSGAGISKNELAERRVYLSENTMRNIIADYIKEHKEINPKPRNNWQIEPAEWLEKRQSIETKILWP